MKKNLEPLSPSVLTNMEFGQLINRHESDLSTIDPTLITDEPYKNYLIEIHAQKEIYQNALAQVRKNEETERILIADKERDQAVSAFNLALKLHASSDNGEEVEVARILRILFGNYKNLAKLNFESESLAIDKLTGELQSPAYSVKIDMLHMTKYVTRLVDTNANFKTLFGSRMVGNAMTETYNMKTIRTNLQEIYGEFCFYVTAMANALDTPLFNISLDLINTARKYYADQLARHIAAKTDEPKVAPD